jgi:hypothetical protein
MAEECDIKLRFVPTGGTSEYRPLECRIFVELKLRTTAEITRLMSVGGGIGIDHDQSVSFLERCWNAISGDNIQRAWELPGVERRFTIE